MKRRKTRHMPWKLLQRRFMLSLGELGVVGFFLMEKMMQDSSIDLAQ
jgi:hypothetical protein